MRKTAESYVKIDPNVLYSAMQKQGITLSNLSRQCGHSRSYFSNIMLKCRVKREVAEKAEEILGVSIITTQNIEDRHPNRRRKITEEQKMQVIECFLTDMTVQEAAKKIGITKEVIEQADQERIKRTRKRPRILRTSSGLMYTR